jgi:toxin ParE1/3/4
LRVKFSPRAERQIDALHAYVSEKSSETRADGYISRIIAFCDGLSTFPRIGTRRDDILPGLRVIGFERRVMIAFMGIDDAVLIEGVFYGGQAFEACLR